MEEKRINTIVTEESIVESLHKQLDNGEFSMLTIPIKQEVESEGEIYECVSSYSVFAVVYHLEGTYNLTAELNPVPKEIFRSFYK